MSRALCLSLLLCAALPAVSGEILVGNKAADTVWRLSLDDGRKLGEFPTNRAPHEIVVNHAGSVALVANYGGGDKPGEKDFAVMESGVMGEFVLANGTKIPSFTAVITQNIWQEKTQTYLQKKVALTIGKGTPAVSQLLAVQPDPGILKTPVFKVTTFKASKN